MPRQAFWPSFPVFHTQEVDVWSFAFAFGRLLVIDRRNSFGRLRRMCSNGYALSKQPKRGVELEPRADLLSAGPSQHQPCIVWREARDRRHLLERARLHTRSHWKGRMLFKAHPPIGSVSKYLGTRSLAGLGATSGQSLPRTCEFRSRFCYFSSFSKLSVLTMKHVQSIRTFFGFQKYIP